MCCCVCIRVRPATWRAAERLLGIIHTITLHNTALVQIRSQQWPCWCVLPCPVLSAVRTAGVPVWCMPVPTACSTRMLRDTSHLILFLCIFRVLLYQQGNKLYRAHLPTAVTHLDTQGISSPAQPCIDKRHTATVQNSTGTRSWHKVNKPCCTMYPGTHPAGNTHTNKSKPNSSCFEPNHEAPHPPVASDVMM